MIVRQATRDDLIDWFGAVPATMRAIVVEEGGKVYGVAGISVMPDHLQAFSAVKPELRRHKYLMAKAAVMFGRMLDESKTGVLAVCSPTEPTAPDLLTRLGFRHWADGVWRHG